MTTVSSPIADRADIVVLKKLDLPTQLWYNCNGTKKVEDNI